MTSPDCKCIDLCSELVAARVPLSVTITNVTRGISFKAMLPIVLTDCANAMATREDRERLSILNIERTLGTGIKRQL